MYMTYIHMHLHNHKYYVYTCRMQCDSTAGTEEGLALVNTLIHTNMYLYLHYYTNILCMYDVYLHTNTLFYVLYMYMQYICTCRMRSDRHSRHGGVFGARQHVISYVFLHIFILVYIFNMYMTYLYIIIHSTYVHAGCEVIGTAGTEEGLALVKAQGAQAVSHATADYMAEIKSLSPKGEGVDIVRESVCVCTYVSECEGV